MKLPASLSRLILAASMLTIIDPLSAGVPTPEPEGDTVLLWPDGAPGGERVTARETFTERAPGGSLRDRIVEHVTRPAMVWFPARAPARGVTLLIVPGGGYARVVIDKEGFESAQWFAEHGFDCAVLRYRLPADGWRAGADAPVHDAVRALRLLRARRGQAPGRFGVIGFSAGGHLVARMITEPALDYAHVDERDELAARPDFAVLMYPVIATTGAAAHAGSVQQLLAAGVSAAQLERYSPQLRVDARTPPTLLVHAADDAAVPVENSILMWQALHKAGVRSQLHVFDRGGHGFGLRGVGGLDVSAWPSLVESWSLGGHDAKTN